MSRFAASSAARPPPITSTDGERHGCDLMEQAFGGLERIQDGLGHAVVQRIRRAPAGPRNHRRQSERDAALDPLHRVEAAMVRDVGGLRRPGRDRPQPGDHDEHLAVDLLGPLTRSVFEHPLEPRLLGRIERSMQLREVPEFGGDPGDGRIERARAWRGVCVRGRRKARRVRAASGKATWRGRVHQTGIIPNAIGVLRVRVDA